MLGVIVTSLAGSLMKVLQLERAGRFTGPNIVFSFPKRPRSGRDPKVRRSDEGAEASRPSPHVQWRAVFLGGVRRSFAIRLRQDETQISILPVRNGFLIHQDPRV